MARDWTLADLASLANTSEEHLRRLCQKNLGRSPGRQLTTLRIAHAAHLLATSDETLRAVGLSRQKISYARSLADEVLSGRLPLEALPEDDEAAIAELTKIKGIGRWSAEIYLLFAEGRPDIWPAGDLAVQQACGRLYGLAERPNEVETRVLAEPWRPRRGAMAIFTWHVYGNPAL